MTKHTPWVFTRTPAYIALFGSGWFAALSCHELLMLPLAVVLFVWACAMLRYV